MANDNITVTLTGDGATGLLPVGQPRLAALVETLPVTVKLGRVLPKSRPSCPTLSSFVDLYKDAPVPSSIDWYSKAAEAIARMYANDRYGCCVFSGKAHNLGIWSANDTDAGPQVLATDKEITDQYFAYTGGRDNGAVIYQVLDYMRDKGFLAGGKRHKIKGYVSCDWRSKELTQIGMALCGPGSIGFNLPGNWPNQAIWDVTNSGFVGGHDVSPCGYNPANLVLMNADGVVVSSWGRLYLFTWAAWQSTRYIDELYFMVPEFLWTGADNRAPSKVDLPKLLENLEQLGRGELPPLPDPAPTPPPVPPIPLPPVPPPVPVPPVPVSYALSLTGEFPAGGLWGGTKSVTMTGKATPLAMDPFPDNFRFNFDGGIFSKLGAGLGSNLGAAFPWYMIVQFAMKVAPIVWAGVQAGKTLQEIIADVLAAIMPQDRATAAAYSLTRDQWVELAKQIVTFLLRWFGVA